jgi:hypothetical protein
MTDEEFARLFPNVKWPQTFEGKDSTYIEPVPKLPAAFSDPLITENTRAPLSIGSFRSRPTTPREILMDNLFRIYGDDSEARHRIDNLMVYPDFFASTLFGTYDTPRALDEGRYKDATLTAITAAAPFLGKPAKFLGDALRRRRSAGLTTNHLADLTPSGITEGPAQSLDSHANNSAAPEFQPQSPSIHTAKRIDKTTDPYDVDFTIPMMPWERSSPWIAPYPPLGRPPRHFSLDYSKEALFDEAGNLRKDVVDGAGNLLKDMEGRKLTAKRIVGRQRIGERDQALSSYDPYSILTHDINADIRPVTPKELIPGAIAQAEMYKPPVVKFWGDLPPDQADTAVAHELGHIFDEIAGRMPIDGLEDELNLLYSELNTNRPGPPLWLPENRGYPPDEVPREKWAEAYRAYDSDPNMIKTVAPKTAATIRSLNDQPFFSKYIQFNNIPLGATLGAGALANAGHESETKATETHQHIAPTKAPDKDYMRKIASALPASKLAPFAPVPDALASIARLLLNGHATPHATGPR